MKKTNLSLLALFLSAAPLIHSKDASTYRSDIQVDGTNKEWATPLPRSDKSTGLQFDIANDERNLYMIVRVADTASQHQILTYGLEVWINMDGKKEMTTGITYPIPPEKTTPGTFQAWRQEQYAKADLPQNPELFTLKGFLLENGKQPVKDNPVQVCIGSDTSDMLVYELKIPFNTFFKEQIEPADLKKKCQFGFVVKGTPDDQMESRMRSVMARQMSMGGFDGPPRGGMSGVMKMINSAGIYIEKIYWLKLPLSLK